MILSFIKIVLLVLVVVVCIIAILLLFNVSYSVQIIKKGSNSKVYIDCSYLFNMFRFKGIYNNGFKYNFRVLFCKFNNKMKTKKKKNDVSIPKNKIDDNNYIFYDKNEILGNEYDIKELQKDEKKNIKNAKENVNNKKHKSIFSKMSYFLKSDAKVALIKGILKRVKETLEIIKPKNVSVKIEYGVLNLFNVGLGLGLASFINSKYENAVEVKQKVSLKSFDCDALLEGKISIYKLLFLFIKLYKDKNTRVLLFE